MTATVDQRTFRYDYYSGSTIGIWMSGDRLIDVVGVEYSLIQTKMPIYGYASSLYDAVADGVVQVSGVLYLNFVQAQTLQAYINNSLDKNTDFIVSPTPAPELEADREDRHDHLALTTQERKNREDKYWGPQGTSRDMEANLDIDTPLSVKYGRPDQHTRGFDIVVTYGKPFQFQNLYGDNSGEVGTNSTMRTLKDVRVTGFGQTISVDGQPIIEQYPFLARTIL